MNSVLNLVHLDDGDQILLHQILLKILKNLVWDKDEPIILLRNILYIP